MLLVRVMTVPETKSCYPLTPLQEGMLLHSIVAPGTGVDVEQLLCDIDHGPPADALHQAWLATLDTRSFEPPSVGNRSISRFK